nr:GNAT family N-acetyltransferase [Roseibium aggregatum]
MEDWALIQKLSRGVVVLDNDRVVATALTTPFGSVATLNMIIVDEAMRGQGLGRRVMNEVMRKAEPDEWRLIATAEGLPLYEKLGFKAVSDIVQHQGIVKSKSRGQQPDGDGAADLRIGSASDAAELAALDQAASGMARRVLVDALFQAGQVFVLEEQGKITAFAALREFGRGKVVGPVVASSPEDAKRLLTHVLKRCEGQFLRVDTDTKTGLGPWLTEQGLAHAGGGTAMRLGKTTKIASSGPQTYTLAAQALG